MLKHINLLNRKWFKLFLFVLVLLGLSLFLAGPSIQSENLEETSQDTIKIRPFTNETIDIPASLDQIFYMVSAQNLILENMVDVELNSTGQFTLYGLDVNITKILAVNISHYKSTIPTPGVNTKLIIEGGVNQNITIWTRLEHKIKVKMANFTLPHSGFIIFITALLTLQLITLATTGHTIIVNALEKVVITITKENFAKPKSETAKIKVDYGNVILEIGIPIILICLGTYAFLTHELWIIKNVGGYYIDLAAKIVLLGTVLAYFFSTIINALMLTIRSLKVRILKNKGPAFVEMYEDFSKPYKTEAKVLFPSVILILITISTLIVYELDLWTILTVTILSCLILYALIYYIKIKLKTNKTSTSEQYQRLVEFIEIDAKTIGFWVFGIIILFASFISAMPIFSSVTTNLFVTDFYPSLFIEINKSFATWVDEAFKLLGQLQVPMCLVLTIPYWTTRAIILKLKSQYWRQLTSDLIIFFSVFVISEYFKWTANVFSENPQPYNINDLFISMLIGMTASILKDLLMEFKPKTREV